jgi:hypothetical protein
VGKVLPFQRPAPFSPLHDREGRATSMRALVTRFCRDCRHEWVQPAAVGDCVACGQENVVNIDSRVCGLTRTN